MIGAPEILAVVVVGLILAGWAWLVIWLVRSARAAIDAHRVRGRR